MIKQIIYRTSNLIRKMTDTQKAYLWIIASLLVYYFLYFLLRKTFSFLYVIPLACFIKGFLYWQPPYKREIKPIFKKTLVVMFILWLILLIIEFYLRISHTL